MKNLLLTLTLLLVINIANATDRIVQELGLGGAYTTINSAISASNDGDRILVYPKSGGYYLENVNDNNKDLHLISAVEGQRFEIFGSVTLHGSILLEAHVIGAITAGANGNGYGAKINAL